MSAPKMQPKTVRYAAQQYQFLESSESYASASPETLKVIDDEVQRITGEQYERAQQLLPEHRPALEHLSQELLETECVDGGAVMQALAVQAA